MQHVFVSNRFSKFEKFPAQTGSSHSFHFPPKERTSFPHHTNYSYKQFNYRFDLAFLAVVLPHPICLFPALTLLHPFQRRIFQRQHAMSLRTTQTFCAGIQTDNCTRLNFLLPNTAEINLHHHQNGSRPPKICASIFPTARPTIYFPLFRNTEETNTSHQQSGFLPALHLFTSTTPLFPLQLHYNYLGEMTCELPRHCSELPPRKLNIRPVHLTKTLMRILFVPLSGISVRLLMCAM